MIPLRLRAETLGWDGSPPVARLVSTDADLRHDCDFLLESSEQSALTYRQGERRIRIAGATAADLDGNVVLVNGARRTLHRLIRPKSPHNTFLVTERCDQLCVMCSQPPNGALWNQFEHYLRAAQLAPLGATIGISGGEPLLLKDDLFHFLRTLGSSRPDLNFHVLTNAQHFEPHDLQTLLELPMERIEWGVPIYASDPALHDKIVGKAGAFAKLEHSLALLAHAAARVEVRTVVTALNLRELVTLSAYLVANVPFAETWAVMQLENIGYGRLNWDALFVDTGENFDPVAKAAAGAAARGLSPRLYNFPLCTVPPNFRRIAIASISDWKQKYLSACSGCSLRAACGGFFEWYPDGRGFMGIRPQ